MPSMIFRGADGVGRAAEFADGDTVMTVAVNNDIPGIIGECGGEMSCGTCHVYVDARWAAALPARGRDEEDMIEVVDDPREASRLGCQLTLTGELDGLTVVVPGS